MDAVPSGESDGTREPVLEVEVWTMTRHRDPYAAAEQRAHDWLASVARQLGTDDRYEANRALRAWLHVVRDRLTVDAAAHLGAQLPELLRGVYVEGWVPGRTPTRYTAAEFVDLFAHVANVPVADAAATAAAVTAALRERFSDGQLDHALAQLPKSLRSLLYYGDYDQASESESDGPRRGSPVTSQRPLAERVEQLEAAVQRLTLAVRALASGLEQRPLDEPTSTRTAVAAHEAHQIMLATDAG